jgi:putative transposase
VVNVLERLSHTRGLPEVITMDNGPEFTGMHMDEWLFVMREIELYSTWKADKNAFAESFNGRLRDECLNTNCLSI